ncbi:DEAD/DEAH box helicase [Metabacillus litoralis]|uniref:DEAD/DEAH box helicase n=1 Tax=Metabacillus litoralis TaxID=152268 RepID=UPI001CFDD70C|nr:AAA domain-containing protein [Metabacillus litoralis]
MKATLTTYQCPITLTNKAKEKMRELGFDERSFFLLEKSFHIYIEKYPQSADRIVTAALFFDNVKNVNLAEKSNNFAVVLHCLVKQDRFVATNVTTRAAHIPLHSNWRKALDIAFEYNSDRSESVPTDLLNLISNMPVAQESSMYVKKRIASWEGYLKIQERGADIPDMTSRYSRLLYNENFSRVTITGCQLNEKEWKSIKDLSVKLKGIDKDIGKVLKVNRSQATVEVELHGYMEEHARKQKLENLPKEVTFSNFAALSQVKRLRQGFKQLENGLAANPELERLLFENKPPVKTVKKKDNLQFHNRLNEFQQEAVIGAMSAEDLYVIQGPPGTGKTTVISEICLQNAKAGLRTLVASQSNLAVDNALGRLLANKDIRILRVGRTESIEEEGKKFIEENVGQYWKDHTLQEVSTQYETRKQREMLIEDETSENEKEQKRLQQALENVEEELKEKEKAKHQYNDLKSFIDKLQKDMLGVEQEQDSVEKQLQKLESTIRTLTNSIEKDESFLANEKDSSLLVKESDENQQEIVKLRKSVILRNLEDEIAEKMQNMKQVSSESEKSKEEVKKIDAVIERMTSVKKVDVLKWIMLEQNMSRTVKAEQCMEEIDVIRSKISKIDKLKMYNETLNRAITHIEKLLQRQNITINQIQERVKNVKAISTTAVEIDQFLDDLRNELIENPKILPQRLGIILEGLYSRRLFIWKNAKMLKSYDYYIKMAQQVLQQLKQELILQLQSKQNDYKQAHEKWMSVMDEKTSKLSFLQLEHKQMIESTEIISNAKELLQQKETKALELLKKKEQYEQAKLRIDDNHQNREKKAFMMQEEKQKEIEIIARRSELKRLLDEKENERSPLELILSTEPEKEQENVLKRLASVSFTRESLKQEKLKLPLFQSIQGKWLSMLKDANDHDLNEIRKLYVKHSNVIGTTCVASARKDFIESYPTFDVVIIDEVSKATPPELLLPMLKGKKIILVGDHHQLPPLLGNDTLEETLQEMAEESSDFEGKTELKNLLKESLFERLFKNLPKANKTMLAIQYRMHKNIMSTISQFYEQENEQLLCGLLDSNKDRDHLLESPLIKRGNHLLWVDMPNESSFFEERMKGGKSLYNPSELIKIGELLKEVDEAVREAKQAGRMDGDEKKSIGVISFYGEQVKRIDRMISQELRLTNLTVRTGTVDRFQGMEMDVILLSMVRNHDNKQDDIGFAKDYRRLNVALSRARELLVLIGSTKMFTESTKHRDTRLMYNHVLEAAKKQDGLRTVKEVSLS